MKTFGFMLLLSTLLNFGLAQWAPFNFGNQNSNQNVKNVVIFKLYTKRSGLQSHTLVINNVQTLRAGNFDPKRHTYFITHGFMGSSDSLSCTLIRYALQKTTDSNIIVVSWSALARQAYNVSRYYVLSVGAQIGKFINFLYENGVNPESITLIGHSLGAHIMGIAGQNVNKKVNHTIGLDPAWPMFESVAANQRLSPDDAIHVEIIHTNGGVLGFQKSLGHYDFFPNGGSTQNSCTRYTDVSYGCSHGRSFQYLAEQISNPGPNFCSLKCNSYTDFMRRSCTKEVAFMGGISSYPASKGQYYLRTNMRQPFSLSTKCA